MNKLSSKTAAFDDFRKHRFNNYRIFTFQPATLFFYQTHPKNTPSGKCGFGVASAKVY